MKPLPGGECSEQIAKRRDATRAGPTGYAGKKS
jgi:hypothetical protein